jgi:hypothetical protein
VIVVAVVVTAAADQAAAAAATGCLQAVAALLLAWPARARLIWAPRPRPPLDLHDRAAMLDDAFAHVRTLHS